jgi:hypothetical protein
MLVPGTAIRAQDGVTPQRPLPGPVVPPPFFREAVQRGTRAQDGRPGPAYWQPHAEYDIEARLDPGTGVITAQTSIRYHNRSPYRLNVVFLNLYQNLHAPGVVRNEPQEVTGGITVGRVAAGGSRLTEQPLTEGPAYAIEGTILAVRPSAPVRAGGTLDLEVEWSFRVPQNSAGRMGHSDREVYFVAYWFPKMAVLDDLRTWDAEPYLSAAEFYDGFGDYRVTLQVPAGWTVMATGELENSADVYTPAVVERLSIAAAADTVVRIAGARELNEGRVTLAPESGWLEYRFAARNVRDFSWSTSNVQTWDATSARVAHAIEHHSRYTAYAYPWPHMTSVEGTDIIGGGMEFPMMTLIDGYQDREAEDLYAVTAHEVAHMWIPMIVGTNERRHAWMDEGSTTFLENEGRPEYWPGSDAHSSDRESYLRAARGEMEKPLMTHGDLYGPGIEYGIASYPKPATLLVALRGLLGEEVFERAYRSFIADWAFRHPSPWDFFNAFEREAGEDLDWFWNTWYGETWALDQAVAGVEATDAGTVITIRDLGFAPMPVLLRIQTTRGGTVERELGVETWLTGVTETTLALPAEVGRVVQVEIDPEARFPDVNRSNNLWVSDAPR